MVKMLRHAVGGLVVFVILITLVVSINGGIKQAYEYEEDDLVEGKNIGERLMDLNIIQGMEKIILAFKDLSQPTGSVFDILGSLASAGLGLLQFVGGVITFPLDILLRVISPHYYIPPIVAYGSVVLLVVYVGFILISKYIKDEV